jgi:hypothetical protein
MPNPDPDRRYITYVAHEEVGRFSTHQEAERRLRDAFEGLEIKFIDARKDIT